uniref:Uncharacterized protein n=1 Tax=Brassica oleracea TaxID=3712 RepID=A0A3P6E868_BRAOL|nr:unnamed protein product [Brassica oleracea]
MSNVSLEIPNCIATWLKMLTIGSMEVSTLPLLKLKWTKIILLMGLMQLIKKRLNSSLRR